MLPIDPHDADHVTSTVAAKSTLLFSYTTGFIGTIWNAPGLDPESNTLCGLLLAVSENERTAERPPDAVGLKTTLTVQLAEALRRQKVDFEELVFPDEIHDFLLHRSWLTAYHAESDFFDAHLSPGKGQ